jgi:CubicO group peptidase (beta-lactamase class C family)
MATGFGGFGSVKTNPNDAFSGYLDGDYDAWYTAGPTAEKLALINRHLKPYPWEPGTVMRYRDQDYFLLGLAIDRFLKSVRGPQADLWQMLADEVFKPIGIHHAPAVRTLEPGGARGVIWANAGWYPTLDDQAKIALLLQAGGAHRGQQLLHRGLTADLLAARGALHIKGDRSRDFPVAEPSTGDDMYRMGYWFPQYTGSASGKAFRLPSMQGSGDNRVTIYPNGIIALLMAKAAELPPGEQARDDDASATHRVVDRMAPF